MKEEFSNNDKDVFLAQWMAGELTDAELKKLVSEDDYMAYLKLRKGIETFESLESSTKASFSEIQRKISEKKTKVRRLKMQQWSIGIAASIILLFGLFTLFGNHVTVLETQFGEQKTIALLDGSEVILNSNSKISYDAKDWKDHRSLTLQGEAFFKVKKGSAFKVLTDNGTVQVLGTQFNVNSSDDFFEVVCYEGKVRVDSKGEVYTLQPTNSVRRINGFALERWQTSELNPTWMDGESSFKSVPLRYVILALESQYQIRIDADSIDQNTRYTGSFTHHNLKLALKTVFKSLDIQYNEKEKGQFYLSTK
ncbi:FecR family protein [Psychroserpens sp. BH13MA-6]